MVETADSSKTLVHIYQIICVTFQNKHNLNHRRN